MSKRELTAHERERIWKQAWFELEGYLLRRMGNVKVEKAQLARLHIQRPYDSDIPKLIHRGAVVKNCTNILALMDSIRGRMFHGRCLTLQQDRELQEALDTNQEGVDAKQEGVDAK